MLNSECTREAMSVSDAPGNGSKRSAGRTFHVLR